MVKARLANFYKLLKKHRRYVILGFIAAILLLFFTAQIKTFIVLSILGVVATFSTFYKRVFQAPPAFELITLTVVAVSIFYGPGVGSLYAVVISISSEVASQALDPFSITYIFPRIVTAFVAPWLYGQGSGPLHNVAMLGLAMSLLYNALQQPVYWFLTDPEKRIKALYFSILNIPINWLVFKFLGGPLFDLLKVLVKPS